MSNTYRDTTNYVGSLSPEEALHDKTSKKQSQKVKKTKNKHIRHEEKIAIQKGLSSGDNESILMPNLK